MPQKSPKNMAGESVSTQREVHKNFRQAYSSNRIDEMQRIILESNLTDKLSLDLICSFLSACTGGKNSQAANEMCSLARARFGLQKMNETLLSSIVRILSHSATLDTITECFNIISEYDTTHNSSNTSKKESFLKRRTFSPVFEAAASAPPSAEAVTMSMQLFRLASKYQIEWTEAEYSSFFVMFSNVISGLKQEVKDSDVGEVLVSLKETIPVIHTVELSDKLVSFFSDYLPLGKQSVIRKVGEVSEDGTIPEVGGPPLGLVDLSVTDRDRTLNQIVELLIKSDEHREHFRKFTDLVEEKGGFDLVIDAANIGYHGMTVWGLDAQNEITQQVNRKEQEKLREDGDSSVIGGGSEQEQTTAASDESRPAPQGEAVDTAAPEADPTPGATQKENEDYVKERDSAKYMKRRVVLATPLRYDFIDLALEAVLSTYEASRTLVILNERHYIEERIPERFRHFPKKWEELSVAVYKTPRGMNDDIFWLYACLYSVGRRQAFVISNDQMRDHHFSMLSQKTFCRWRSSHQVKHGISNPHQFQDSSLSEIKLFYPPKYTTCIQYSDEDVPRHYRFPLQLPDGKLEWLCVGYES